MIRGRGDKLNVSKKNRHEFFKYYIDLCYLHNIVPSPAVKQSLKNANLSLCGDRIRFEDWQLIIKALCSDLSLETIFIWSRYCKVNTAFLTEGFRRKSVIVRNIPVFLSPKILSSLISSIVKCLRSTNVLSTLKLHFLPLLSHDSKLLSENIGCCCSLQHLSLSYCHIGDESCIALCKSLKSCRNLKTLNLSGCSISDIGASAVANLIKVINMEHSLVNYNEIWSTTLRSNRGILETDEGLKRVTLNHNPSIGDTGVDHLAVNLMDDLSVNVIDLQDCGVGNIGGEIFKCLLKVNKILKIVDVRYNEDLDLNVFDEILNLLTSNNLKETSEYHWLRIDPFIKLDSHQINKWQKYEHMSSSCKTCSSTKNNVIDSKSYSISRNRLLDSGNESSIEQEGQKQKGVKIDDGRALSETVSEYVCVEKSMLLDISLTLQQINFFIRRLDLPQLVSILKEIKSQAEQFDTCPEPVSKNSKENISKITISEKNPEELWSDQGTIPQNVNEIFSRSLYEMNSFDSSKKCACCNKGLNEEIQNTFDYSNTKNFKHFAYHRNDKKLGGKLISTENSRILFDLLQKYSSTNNQNLPIT